MANPTVGKHLLIEIRAFDRLAGLPMVLPPGTTAELTIEDPSILGATETTNLYRCLKAGRTQVSARVVEANGASFTQSTTVVVDEAAAPSTGSDEIGRIEIAISQID